MTDRLLYGRQAARFPVGLRHIAHYLENPLPAAPTSVEIPRIPNWGMYGNDQYGDCTIAAVVHLRMANAAQRKVNESFPSAQQAVDTYLALGHGQDQGLVESDVLHTWATAGLFGDKIAGYAPLNHHNPDELRSVVAKFGGAYLGVAMPAPAQDQFAAGVPWDLTGTADDRNIEGGHAIPAVAYDKDLAYVVTWGKLQPVTWRWLTAYLDESWAAVTSEDSVDLTSLRHDLKLIESWPLAA